MSCRFSCNTGAPVYREVVSEPKVEENSFFKELLQNSDKQMPLTHWRLLAADIGKIATELNNGWHLEQNPDIGVPSGTLGSGLTYLAQLVTHDIVESRVPDSGRSDVTPFLNLDSIYPICCEGNPDPMIIDNEGLFHLEKLADINNVVYFDFKRIKMAPNLNLAKIREPRNDENQIISQLVVLVMRYHNGLVCYLRETGRSQGRSVDYCAARVMTVLMLQKIVIFELLESVLSCDVFHSCFIEKEHFFFHGHDRDNLTIPKEFSHAFFRFGHSMVRQRYQMNSKFKSVTLHHLLKRDTVLPCDRHVEWELFFKKKSDQVGPPLFNLASKLGLSVAGGMSVIPEKIEFDKINEISEQLVSDYELPPLISLEATTDQFPKYLFRNRELSRLVHAQGLVNIVMEDIDASSTLPTGGDLISGLDSSEDPNIKLFLKKSKFPDLTYYKDQIDFQRKSAPLKDHDIFRVESNGNQVREKINFHNAPLWVYALREAEIFPEKLRHGSLVATEDKLGPLTSVVIAEVLFESIRLAEISLFDLSGVNQQLGSLKAQFNKQSENPKMATIFDFVNEEEGI